ncbi:hypothetical protein F4802DRAFT_600542 [Xylaria palmicola]|nr:hypothetical protein F4802DRAFT_600542 [Xylaria palmicola]
MWNLEKPEVVGPVEPNDDTALNCLDIASLDSGAGDVDLRNTGGMDIGRKAGVMLARLLSLVFAHDLGDADSPRQSASEFWRLRFPDVLVTDFPFFD